MKILQVDYKKELETASKGMIMIHDPKLLIKLILRMLVSKVKIKHAGMILYEPEQNCYVLNVSKGERGFKIPAGFVQFDEKNSIIKFFTKKEFRPLRFNKNAIVTEDLNKLIWKESVVTHGNGTQELLQSMGQQMQMFNAVACVPSYYQRKLLAVLLLGEKEDGTRFDQNELDFFAALASDAAMAIRNAQLFDDLRKESQRNRDLFLRTTMVLSSAIEAKDKYTHGHTERVTKYAVAIARQMVANGSANFDEAFFESLYLAGTLHDIGKIGVPEGILNKIGNLSQEEVIVMKKHPNFAMEILQPLSELKDSLEGIKYHHERYDGKGYPDGLKGEEIPVRATIIAVADSFDAITTDRPYRKGLSKAQAIEEIRNNIGIQFSPRPAKAMIELFEAGKI
ncbi:MAG: HD-GYP domain-containing protein [Candidatus Omnitrophica bacterium]|nr:HD-GYP domain-containing protein [Candidatus Omnitrophota bacterium]